MKRLRAKSAWRWWGISLAVVAISLLPALILLGALSRLDHRPGPAAPANPKDVPDGPNPPQPQFGWLGPDAARRAFEQIQGEVAPFRIVGAGAQQDNRSRRVVHWSPEILAVTGGRHLPTVTQQIGDCVGAGAKQAVDYLLRNQIALDGHKSDFRPSYLPYHYAVGRNAPECGDGNMGRDPSGSTGGWQAVALKLYGIYPEDAPGLEPYSKAVVSRWAIRMPEAKYLEEGRRHLIRTVALAESVDQVRDALCNYYTVTTASDWGGLMEPPVEHGRRVNRRSGRWLHQQCIIGYDGREETVQLFGEPLYYVLNSWGESVHGRPADDAPPGGYWVREREVRHMIGDRDSYVLSAHEGFPSQGWRLVDSRPPFEGLPFHPNPEEN